MNLTERVNAVSLVVGIYHQLGDSRKTQKSISVGRNLMRLKDLGRSTRTSTLAPTLHLTLVFLSRYTCLINGSQATVSQHMTERCLVYPTR